MKKINLILLVAFISLSSMVKASQPDYIITGDDVYFFNKVRTGIMTNIVGIHPTGKMRFHTDEVVAYCKDGRVYEKMPVVINNRETGKSEFMELVAYRNGLKVYRHPVYSGIPGNKENEYVVFQNGQYHVCFDEQNCENLCKFFSRW